MGFSLKTAFVARHTHSTITGDGGNVLSQHYVYAPDKSQLLLFRDSGLTQGVSIFTWGVFGGLSLVGNGLFDGVSWNRFNTSYPLWVLQLQTETDEFVLFRAPPGANPAILSAIFKIRKDGKIILPDMGALVPAANNTGTFWPNPSADRALHDLSQNVFHYFARDGEIYGVAMCVTTNSLDGSCTVYLWDGSTATTLFTVPAGGSGTFTWSGALSTTVSTGWKYRFATSSVGGGINFTSASVKVR